MAIHAPCGIRKHPIIGLKPGISIDNQAHDSDHECDYECDDSVDDEGDQYEECSNYCYLDRQNFSKGWMLVIFNKGSSEKIKIKNLDTSQIKVLR